MRLGPLSLKSNLFLSPLAGYTNLPFRLTVRELGGLGLATTYGIVKQHSGWIEVDTAVGVGTQFNVYFPAAPRTAIGCASSPI